MNKEQLQKIIDKEGRYDKYELEYNVKDVKKKDVVFFGKTEVDIYISTTDGCGRMYVMNIKDYPENNCWSPSMTISGKNIDMLTIIDFCKIFNKYCKSKGFKYLTKTNVW